MDDSPNAPQIFSGARFLRRNTPYKTSNDEGQMTNDDPHYLALFTPTYLYQY